MSMPKKNFHKRALTLLLLSSTLPLSGANIDWTGSAVDNNDMVSNADWVGVNLPTISDNAVFPNVAPARNFPNLGITGTLFNIGDGSLIFESSDIYTFTISGGSSLICGGVTFNPIGLNVANIFNLNSGSIQFIQGDAGANFQYFVGDDAYISFLGNATAANSSTFFNLTNNGTLNFNNNVNIVFTGSVDGAGIINIDPIDEAEVRWASPGGGEGSGVMNVINGILRDNFDDTLPLRDYFIAPGGILLISFDEEIGSLAGSGKVTVNGDLVLSNNTSTNFSGVLQNTVIGNRITKQGTGVFTLSGNSNTFDGIFDILEGTLQAGAVNAFSPAFTIELSQSGAALDLNGYNNTIRELAGAAGTTIALGEGTLTLTAPTGVFSGNIYGPGGLTITGGTLAINGTTNYTGLTTINGGTLSMTASNTIGPLSGTGGTLNINANTVRVNNYRDTSYGGVIAGSGTFAKQGEGVLALSGANTLSGTLAIQDGTIRTDSATALPPAAVVLGPNATLDLNNISNSTAIRSLAGDGGLVALGSATLTAGTNNTTFSGSITGTGGLTLNGVNSLTLTGPNSYSGITTLNDSANLISQAKNSFSPNSDVVLNSGTQLTLNQYDNAIGSVTGSGNIDLTGGGTLTLADSNGAIFSGQISGSGGLIKQGTGPFVLTGVQKTYSGPTQVQSGTLVAGSVNTLSPTSAMVISPNAELLLNNNSNVIGPLSGAGKVTLGTGTLTTQMTEATTFAGNISGTGGLTVSGISTLTLSGTNTFSGDTDLTSPGTLAAGATNSLAADSTVLMDSGSNLYLNNFDNTIGALSGDDGNVVLGTGVLTLGGNNDTTNFGGVISGRGGIVKEGSGTFTISGDNTYTGKTVISDGTLVSVDGSLPYNSPVVDNSHLVFDQSTNVTQCAPISGSGDVTITGPGSITLLGCNSYTGGTFVNSGSTLIGNSNSLQGAIHDSGTVIFNQNFCGAFSGSFTGNGIIRKQGCAQLTMCLNSKSFAGTTFVDQGILKVKGSLGGNMVVNAGGTITGNFNLGGNFTQNSGSTYLVDVDFLGNSSLIHAAGSATLNGGTVQVAANCCFNLDERYLILEADEGIFGKYDSVVTDFNTSVPYKGVLTYTTNDLFLEIVPAFLDCIDGRCTCNQKQIAAQFDAINDLPFIPAHLLDVLNTMLGTPGWQICSVLDQLTGEQYTSNFITAELNSRQFIRRLYDPIRNIVTNASFFDPCDPCFTMQTNCADLWFEVSGGQICNSRRRDLHGFTTSGVQVTGGVQRTFGHSLTAGIAGSYAYDNTHFFNRGNANTSTGFGGLYGVFTGDQGYFLGNLAYGYASQKMDRKIQFDSFDFKARGTPNYQTFTFYTEAGTDYLMGNLLVQPFVGIEADYLHRSQFHEHNADVFALHFKDYNQGSWFSRFGLHLTNHSCGLDLSADLAWQCCLIHRNWKSDQYFEDFGDRFGIVGPSIPRSSFDGAVTATKELTEYMNVYAEVAGQVWSHLSTYSITVGAQGFW